MKCGRVRFIAPITGVGSDEKPVFLNSNTGKRPVKSIHNRLDNFRCSGKVSWCDTTTCLYETGDTMYKKDPRFETPDDVSKIWRYMNYDKFKSFIVEKILFFCSIDTLKKADPYEGSYYACKLLNEVNPSDAQHFVSQINQCGLPIAVNCWHLSEHDSMAMWKIYSGDKGIAVQTTIQKFKAAFEKYQDSVKISKISYTDEPIDHPIGWSVGKLFACMTKRKCYEHEKEVRALIWETTEINRTKDGSAIVPIEINNLIENIFLSPTSEDNMMNNVCVLLNKSGIHIKPKKSQILTSPPF